MEIMETEYIKSISITEKEWEKIRTHIKQDYGEKILLITYVLRRELGFTPRIDRKWIDDGDYGSGYQTTVWLDFYNEEQKTFFMLKYLNRD